MRVVFVVDSVTDIKHKIDLIKSHYGNDIIFIVKAQFKTLFSTFGYQINAIYYNNLARVMHRTLEKLELKDTIICHSSITLDNAILDKFNKKLVLKDKIVNVIPKYNWFEIVNYSIYNVYVKSLFKSKDSMASPKLQFLPSAFVGELLASHFGNKMFEINEKYVNKLEIEDAHLSKQLKPKVKFNKFHLIPLIVALAITYGLIMYLMFSAPNFFVILTFVFLYILDIVVAIIFQCKLTFDTRFLK